MRLVGILVVLATIGCVRTQSQTCGDRVCPDGTTCAVYRDLVLCVSPDQTAACEALAPGDACMAGAIVGFCHDGACLPVGCGNGRIDDPVFATDEECDDGNRISHDGCSSTCRDEAPRIDEIYPYGLYPLTETAIALDTSSDTMLMFGGAEYGQAASSSTWAYIEEQWRRIPTRTGPSGRRGHGMAYDQRRQRLVMFGGNNGDSRLSDTWELDGTSWHSRDPVHTPPPRQSFAMAYDPVRGVTVMFGGGVPGEPGDTWEWDGDDWTERVDAMPPPLARAHQAMAFDPVRGVMVMVVESTADGVVTYELADDGWHLIATADRGPAPGTDSPLAFDALAQRIVRPGAQLSAWDGEAWTSIANDDIDRKAAALAMLRDGRVLRVGGNASDGGMAWPITQEWSGAQWLERSAPGVTDAHPSARTDFVTAYDQRRHRVVLFGGMAVAPLGDTWELGPGGWKRMAVTGPPARTGHAMAFDAKRGETVLFGDAAVAGDRRTWTWNGTAWTEHAPVPDMPARGFPAMGYDIAREVVVLHGGVDSTGLFDDTWEWNGTTWTRIATTSAPPPRADAALAYDPLRAEMILFGGRARAPITYGDTWTWDGAQWTRRQPPAVPTARYGHGLAWDPARRRILLLGGITNAGLVDPAVRDVWEWDGATWSGVDIIAPSGSTRVTLTPGFAHGTLAFVPLVRGVGTFRIEWSAGTAYETCTQADHDRDGLVGCADLDCWSTCTPACMPGETCGEGPRCGDQVCSDLERCSTCPQDCTGCAAVCGDGTCSAGESCVGDCSP